MSELPITITLTSTPQLALRSYRACHRRTYRRQAALTATFLILGTAQIAAALVWQGVALALYGVLFSVVRERAVRKQLATALRGDRDVTITITDTEYRTQGQDVATCRAWSAFTGVSRVGDFWVLRVSPQAAMGLPASALDERQTAAFVSLIQAKGLG